MADNSVLNVYQGGKVLVVGFADTVPVEEVSLAACRDELVDLIREHEAETLAFDLTGIVIVPSGALGLIASMRKLGVSVHVYKPSDDIRDVFEITKLDQIVHIHKIDVC